MAELIIVFREVLEATLIVGILYTFLKQTNQEEALTKLWQGVLLALAASIVGSFLFQQFAGGFTGQAGKLFEGIVMIVAAGVLGTVIVWMAKNNNIAEDLNVISDFVDLTVTAGYGKEVTRALVEKINANPHSDGALVLADMSTTTLADATVSANVVHPQITAVNAITVASAFS